METLIKQLERSTLNQDETVIEEIAAHHHFDKTELCRLGLSKRYEMLSEIQYEVYECEEFIKGLERGAHRCRRRGRSQ